MHSPLDARRQAAKQRRSASPHPDHKATDDVALQRTIGNRAVARLLGAQPTLVARAASGIGNQAMARLIGSGTVQAKLQVGAAGDKYEQEADRVADEVMRRRLAPSAASARAESGPDSGDDPVQIGYLRWNTTLTA